MKVRLFTTLFILCATQLPAQVSATASETSASAPGRVAQTHTSDIGFSYSLPLDWEVVDTKPIIPVVKQQQIETAGSEGEKKGIACTQVDLMARYGSPASVIVVLVMPHNCFEKPLTDKDLSELATGVSIGLKKKFEIADPVYGAYKLGSHSFWIERASGTLIDHPEIKRTVETVCSVLKKGVVCWMTMAVDQESLQTFEHGAVTLDGYTAAALVPADALKQNP
ncbi:MAG: hypothetical protein WCA89_05495 [Terracidiphilus sp.]|jgi:hypothetical protein